MQFADGGDLLQKITERKAKKVFFRESQVWRVLIETVHGLHAMHEMNIMHRDIKSANIFLCRPGQANKNRQSIAVSQKSGIDEKGSYLFQAQLGDMNVSKITKGGMNQT